MPKPSVHERVFASSAGQPGSRCQPGTSLQVSGLTLPITGRHVRTSDTVKTRTHVNTASQLYQICSEKFLLLLKEITGLSGTCTCTVRLSITSTITEELRKEGDKLV